MKNSGSKHSLKSTQSNLFACKKSNSQNREDPIKRNKTQRLKSDHSIETKSPIKIPQEMAKPDLTFRKKGQEEIDNPESDREKTILYSIWQSLGRLGNCSNPIVKGYLPYVKAIVKEMVVALAQQNIKQDQEPLASSQKIKLQNLVCPSHCDGDGSSRVRQSQQIPTQSKRSVKPSDENFQKTSHSTMSFKEPKQELEVKKIMYMLEGGKNKHLKQPIQIDDPLHLQAEDNLGSVPRRNFESLSSFNQNPSEDSGFTVLEIEKQSQRSTAKKTIRLESLLENQWPTPQKPSAKEKLLIDQGHEQQQRQTSSSGSRQTHKRKVLNDIITMLNQKYNKNIQLQ